ncbi:MAG: isoamylase early set domain-containing protein [Litorilinea sp.]
MLKRETTKHTNQIKVTFVVPDDPDLPRISVVGDFNNWDPEAHKLVRRSNNTRSVSLLLDAGAHYAFRYYTEEGRWFNDEAADGYAENEHGTQNGLIHT